MKYIIEIAEGITFSFEEFEKAVAFIELAVAQGYKVSIYGEVEDY